MNKIECPTCGYPNDADSAFCIECGTPLNSIQPEHNQNMSNNQEYFDYGRNNYQNNNVPRRGASHHQNQRYYYEDDQYETYERPIHQERRPRRRSVEKLLVSGKALVNKVFSIITASFLMVAAILLCVRGIMIAVGGTSFMFIYDFILAGGILGCGITALITAIINRSYASNLMILISGTIFYLDAIVTLIVYIVGLDSLGKTYLPFLLLTIVMVFLFILLITGIVFLKKTAILGNISLAFQAIFEALFFVGYIILFNFNVVNIFSMIFAIVAAITTILAILALGFLPKYKMVSKEVLKFKEDNIMRIGYNSSSNDGNEYYGENKKKEFFYDENVNYGLDEEENINPYNIERNNNVNQNVYSNEDNFASKPVEETIITPPVIEEKPAVKTVTKEINDEEQVIAKLNQLKKLLDEGVLTQEEFNEAKKKYISKL